MRGGRREHVVSRSALAAAGARSDEGRRRHHVVSRCCRERGLGVGGGSEGNLYSNVDREAGSGEEGIVRAVTAAKIGPAAVRKVKVRVALYA